MFALSLWAPPAMAQDASACIEPGRDAKKAAHTLTNGCPIDVVVFWCHHGAGRREAACDPSRKFYRQNTVLKPGEVKANPYAMPLGDDLSFGGCFGNWSSYLLVDGEGRYQCPPMRLLARAGEQPVRASSRGATVDDACAAARRLALPYGEAGECRCETANDRTSVCRVDATVKADGGPSGHSVLEKLRKTLRERLAQPCAEGGACPPRRSGGTGLRG